MTRISEETVSLFLFLSSTYLYGRMSSKLIRNSNLVLCNLCKISFSLFQGSTVAREASDKEKVQSPASRQDSLVDTHNSLLRQLTCNVYFKYIINNSNHINAFHEKNRA